MTCKSILRGAVFLGGVTLGTLAQAATIVDIQGEVLVSMGAGFQPVGAPFVLRPGNQLFVRPGGAANLQFDDGCKVPVEPGTVVQIGETSPCRSAKAAEGGTAGVHGSTLLVGGLVIAGGAALAVGLSGGGGKDKPASP
jgi:hypothetical protein